MYKNETFNQDETTQLLMMIEKFEQAICEIEAHNPEESDECYNRFFERLWKQTQSGDLDIGISRSQQSEILGALSQTLRNEIWESKPGQVNIRYPEDSMNGHPDTMTTITSYTTRYLQFLENDIAPINSKTKKYFEHFRDMGGISPSTIGDVLENYASYDIKDERIKLLIAIHYLNFNNVQLEHNASYEKIAAKFENK